MDYPKISVKAARVNAEMTQAEAANRLSIHVSTLQKYENGETVPPWTVVLKMSELYAIGVDFLFLKQRTA